MWILYTRKWIHVNIIEKSPRIKKKSLAKKERKLLFIWLWGRKFAAFFLRMLICLRTHTISHNILTQKNHSFHISINIIPKCYHWALVYVKNIMINIHPCLSHSPNVMRKHFLTINKKRNIHNPPTNSNFAELFQHFFHYIHSSFLVGRNKERDWKTSFHFHLSKNLLLHRKKK